MEKYYYSTRNKNHMSNDIDAILNGLGEDGGLYVWKDKFPTFPLDSLREMNYQQICTYILASFLPSFNQSRCEAIVSEAYCNTFDNQAIAPVISLRHDYILELFHGPTAAFKDLALCVLPRMISEALAMNCEKQKLMILTATSGDTGKAAMSGFQDVPNTAIMVFYPNDGVSAIQQKQMTTQLGDNIKVKAIKGNFDDAQTLVKTLFQDVHLQTVAKQYGYHLSSANSINIGRLLPQITYYFDSYRQLLEQHAIKPSEEVCFSVPTGNFGDILAGYYAKKMGLPIYKLICGVNENRVLYDFFQTGRYDRNRPFYKTTSPSMDILISSNLERFLFECSDHDDVLINSLMMRLQTDGCFEVPVWLLQKMQAEIFVDFACDEDSMEAIQTVFQSEGYMMDPHTAVAWIAKMTYQQQDKLHPMIVLSTASPYKFPKTVLQAIHQSENMDEWQCIDALFQMSKVSIPYGLTTIQKLPERFVGVQPLYEMYDEVLSFLKELK